MFFSLAHYRFFFWGGVLSCVQNNNNNKKELSGCLSPLPQKKCLMLLLLFFFYFFSLFYLGYLDMHVCAWVEVGTEKEEKKKVPGNEESVFSTVFRVHAQRRRTGASWFFFFFYFATTFHWCHRLHGCVHMRLPLVHMTEKKKENSQEVEETHNNRRKSCSNSHNKKEESKKKNCSSHFFFLCRLFFPHFSFPPSWYIYILFVCLFLFFLRLTFFHFFFLFSLSPTVLQDYPHVNWVFSFLCSIFFSSLSRFVCCDFLMCCFYISLLFIHILSCLCLDLPRFWCYLCFFFPSFSVFFFSVVVVVLSGFDRLTFLMSFFRCSLSCRCSTEVAFHLFFPCFMLDHCAKAHFLKTKSNFFFRGRLKKWCLNNVLATRSVRCWRVQTLVWVVIICFSPLPFAIIFSSLFFFFVVCLSVSSFLMDDLTA